MGAISCKLVVVTAADRAAATLQRVGDGSVKKDGDEPSFFMHRWEGGAASFAAAGLCCVGEWQKRGDGANFVAP